MKDGKGKKEKLLAALFAEAKKVGVDQETLRNEVAPAVIKKRLSMASAQEVLRVIEHVTGKSQPPRPSGTPPYLRRGAKSKLSSPPILGGVGVVRYESSKSGLLQELEDVARERWGEGFAKSLNAFINANREIQTHYKMMGVTGLKALKERIKEMNRKEKNEVA
ncbi:hypothetical protein A2V82_16435 [candidate division KSB1 bacterium RBG_16_48_16]|nr:MAG: hypothetical protein A2V82_16435 [candidate division KSB1 bacterium RBG_16_48_16]